MSDLLANNERLAKLEIIKRNLKTEPFQVLDCHVRSVFNYRRWSFSPYHDKQSKGRGG